LIISTVNFDIAYRRYYWVSVLTVEYHGGQDGPFV